MTAERRSHAEIEDFLLARVEQARADDDRLKAPGQDQKELDAATTRYRLALKQLADFTLNGKLPVIDAP